jgi:hypothetical protein
MQYFILLSYRTFCSGWSKAIDLCYNLCALCASLVYATVIFTLYMLTIFHLLT